MLYGGPRASQQTCRDRRRLWERFAIAMRRRCLKVPIAAASRSHSTEVHSTEGRANGLGTTAALRESLGAWHTQRNVWAEQQSAFNSSV